MSTKLTDAGGGSTTKVKLSYNKKTKTLKVTPNKKWWNSKKRKFPVEIRTTYLTDRHSRDVKVGAAYAGSPDYTYDYRNHLTAMKNQTGSAGVISQYTSEYLANGQKSKETSDVVDKDGKKSKKTATYTYDLLGRITKETKTGNEDIFYTYDSNNNRKEMRVGNKITAYKYNKSDELLRTDTLNTDTKEDSVVIYKNDKNGNQLATVTRYEIPSDKKDKTYIDIDVTLGDNRLNENVVNHYNAENQLIQSLTKNYKVSFTYDAEGLRTSKTVNGEKTVFVWDGDQLVMELSDSGKVQKRYIRGNDLVYADKGKDNAASEASEKQYYVTDPHGNVVQLTDENGAVTKTYEYDSFGNEIKPDEKDDNPFRYCGEYYDKEIGEVYLRARYYQLAVGRFLTRDTYTGEDDEPTTLHLYTYCENDGVNMVDPSGHWGEEESKYIVGQGKDAKKRAAEIRKIRGYKYKYVHQNITYYALERLFEVNIKYVENERWFKKVIKGSIAPDKYMNNPKHFKKYKIKPLTKNSLHGKSREKCEDLCTRILKKLNKNKRKDAAYLTGIALHTIQDYYAHSYGDMTLEEYKKNVSKYYGKEDYVRANEFHLEWAYEYKEKKKQNGDKKKIKNTRKELHSKYKDNPDMDFDFATNTWVSVNGDRMKNMRYYNACNASYVYLMKSLKKMKIVSGK